MKEKIVNISIIAIFIFALLFRVVYVQGIKINVNTFDIGLKKIESEESYDKIYTDHDKDPLESMQLDYIMRIYDTWKLPEKIVGQFYHPPLFFFSMASWLKIADSIFDLSSQKIESMQYILVIYSMITMYIFYRIMHELEISKKNRIIPLILFSCYPIYVMLSGMLTNDGLVTLFELASLLYIIKWEKKPSIKNAVWLAIYMGFGMMTKSSMLVMLVPALYVYFSALIKNYKDTELTKKLVIALLLYMIIFLTLGGWFHFTRLVKGLYTIGIVQPLENLNISNHSIWERFGICNLLNGNEANIWSELLATSMISVYTQEVINLKYTKMLFLLVIVLSIYTIYIALKNIKKQRTLLLTAVTWWMSYLFLNIRMPYICSMNARYVVVPFIIGLIYIGLEMQDEDKKEDSLIKFLMKLYTLAMMCMCVIWLYLMIK